MRLQFRHGGSVSHQRFGLYHKTVRSVWLAALSPSRTRSSWKSEWLSSDMRDWSLLHPSLRRLLHNVYTNTRQVLNRHLTLGSGDDSSPNEYRQRSFSGSYQIQHHISWTMPCLSLHSMSLIRTASTVTAVRYVVRRSANSVKFINIPCIPTGRACKHWPPCALRSHFRSYYGHVAHAPPLWSRVCRGIAFVNVVNT